MPHLSQTNWQNPDKLQKILEKTRQDRKKLYQVLRQLDTEKTGYMTFSIFQQAATDNNINLDENSVDYIIKHKCDKQG